MAMSKGCTVLKTDPAGNKICKKFIKTRKVWQFYVKNRSGRLVNEKDTLKLLKKHGYLKGKRVRKVKR